MSKNGIGTWISRRFVLLCEITGYTITAGVAAFVVFAIFRQVDTVAASTGSLRVASSPVAADVPALVAQYTGANGAEVTTGAPVARVITDPVALRTARARRMLEKAGDLLDAAPAAAEVKGAAARLDAGPAPRALAAPAAGLLRTLPPDDMATTGQPVARVYDTSALVFEGALEKYADQVAAGQPARAVVADLKLTLSGRVEKVVRADGASTVTIRFTVTDPALRDQLRRRVLETPSAEFPAQKIETVVGTRSLFTVIFSRR